MEKKYFTSSQFIWQSNNYTALEKMVFILQKALKIWTHQNLSSKHLLFYQSLLLILLAFGFTLSQTMIFFSFLHKNICCGYSSEVYTLNMFLLKNKIFTQIFPLTRTMSLTMVISLLNYMVWQQLGHVKIYLTVNMKVQCNQIVICNSVKAVFAMPWFILLFKNIPMFESTPVIGNSLQIESFILWHK